MKFKITVMASLLTFASMGYAQEGQVSAPNCNKEVLDKAVESAAGSGVNLEEFPEFVCGGDLTCTIERVRRNQTSPDGDRVDAYEVRLRDVRASRYNTEVSQPLYGNVWVFVAQAADGRCDVRGISWTKAFNEISMR